ncbi:hypothetical protein OIU76_022665 [Salix suchowensis]|nr:hypothetical protein OIU76_022665 [Salix suchowensis]
MFEQPLLKITLVDILEATNNFCKTNIIGDGGFGTVYKATLPGVKTVAVKKLSQAKTQGNREFIAEMETLGKVKHQNLVPLLGYCSFGEEKLLVYEYMIKKDQAADVLDPTALSADSKQMMLQVLQIAAVCLSDNPAKRPTMLKVLKFLKGIKDE